MQGLSVDRLFDILATRGEGAYGLSGVNQIEHALQSAALAKQRNLSDAMIIAVLFHDVGHLAVLDDVDLASEGIDDVHEEVGARMLQSVFGDAVSGPVLHHVAAKRYLCAVERDYYDKLSEDSRISLKLQGGLMSDEEAASFKSQPGAEQAVVLRRIDDEAKQAGLEVPPLASYRPMAERLAAVVAEV